MPLRVWLNKSFTSTYNVIETIRAADAERRFELVCSHSNRHFAAFEVADEHEVEPAGLTGAAYVDYCLETCRRKSVDVFVPGKAMALIAESGSRFEALGVRLLVAAAPEVLRRIEHKSRLYEDLDADVIPVPEHHTVRTLAEFDDAYQKLRLRHAVVCVKPAISVFGLGFRAVTEKGLELDRLLAGETLRIGLAELRRLLGQRETFRDVMVMPYLEGPEHSVDCLAHEGELVRAVARRKSQASGGGQVLEDNPALVAAAARLTRRFGLRALYNVQMRESGGVPYLLEINPRMSGGLHFSCLSGVAFPYWALRLATGSATPDDVPLPRLGLRIGQINRGFVLRHSPEAPGK